MPPKRDVFYAVAEGREPGIYSTWPECEEQVKGYSGARYKKFSIKPEAEEFIAANKVNQNLTNNAARAAAGAATGAAASAAAGTVIGAIDTVYKVTVKEEPLL